MAWHGRKFLFCFLNYSVAYSCRKIKLSTIESSFCRITRNAVVIPSGEFFKQSLLRIHKNLSDGDGRIVRDRKNNINFVTTHVYCTSAMARQPAVLNALSDGFDRTRHCCGVGRTDRAA